MLTECLRRHVRSCSWDACQRGFELAWSNIEDSSHSQVGYLGLHVRGQKDILSREIAVDYWRLMTVEKRQALSHILQDRPLQSDREIGCAIKDIIQAGLQMVK